MKKDNIHEDFYERIYQNNINQQWQKGFIKGFETACDIFGDIIKSWIK